MTSYNIIGIRYNKKGKATHFAVVQPRSSKCAPEVCVLTGRELLASALADKEEAEYFVWRPKFFGKTPVKVVVSTGTDLDGLTYLPRI